MWSFFLWKKSVDSLFNMFNKWKTLHDKERSTTYFVIIFNYGVWSKRDHQKRASKALALERRL